MRYKSGEMRLVSPSTVNTYYNMLSCLEKCFSALNNIVKLETEHVWPDDLASESVRHTYSTSLYNGPQGRNILQRKVRCHQKPASTTVNTIMAYKLSAVFFFINNIVLMALLY